MDGLFLLYFLTYVPISGTYGPALDKARSAAFIQSGIASDFEVVKHATEKKLPKELSQAAVIYNVAQKQELSWRGHTLDGTVNRNGGSLTLHVEF